MASAAIHRLGAALAVGGGLMLTDEERKEPTAKPLTAGAIAYACGTLPDIIEPAFHPNHRQFFHSWAVMGLVGYGIYRTYEWQPKNEWEKAVRLALFAIGGAYAAHLLMDSKTPKGLPIICTGAKGTREQRGRRDLELNCSEFIPSVPFSSPAYVCQRAGDLSYAARGG